MAKNPVAKSALADEILNILLGQTDDQIVYGLNDSIQTTKKSIEEAFNNSKPIKAAFKDSYGNSLTATGSDDKVKSFTKYGFNNDTLNFSLWTALYNDSWVFKKAIDKPAEDMVKCGIEIKGKADVTKVMKEMRKANSSLIRLVKWGRLYGGSVALIQFDKFDDKDYMEPISKTINKIKESKTIRFYVTDRWYGVAQQGTSTVTDMASLDFGKPKTYEITYANGKTVNALHDYVLRFENRDAPNLVKNGMLQGWGYAEGAHILNEIARDDQLKSAITSLVNKSLIEVVKMSGMRGAFMGADKDGELQLRKRLEMVNWARNFNSLTFLDKDDDYQEHGFSGLGGLADLLDKNMILISAAVDMPGILFGDMSQGFAVDKDAMKRYSEVIHDQCEAHFRVVVEKLLGILYKKYDIKEEVDFEFRSLIEREEKDEQVNRYKTFIDLLSSLMSDGVLDAAAYGKALQKYVQEDTVDFGLDEKALKKLEENYAAELEKIDLGDK